MPRETPGGRQQGWVVWPSWGDAWGVTGNVPVDVSEYVAYWGHAPAARSWGQYRFVLGDDDLTVLQPGIYKDACAYIVKLAAARGSARVRLVP